MCLCLQEQTSIVLSNFLLNKFSPPATGSAIILISYTAPPETVTLHMAMTAALWQGAFPAQS